MTRVHSRHVDVGGVRTHYLDAGDGPVAVLLHSGEYGGCAELTWEHNVDALARHFRVIAPDWLGFGGTDKLRDFVSGSERMIRHMAAFLDVMAIDHADFVGSSMGATYLVREAARERPRFRIRRMVLTSGGGFVPDNEHRRSTLEYDGTAESMQTVLKAMFSDSRWWTDEAYVRRRVQASLAPGAFEAISAARLTSPNRPPRSEFGQPDTTPYERVRAPTLVVAGAEDKLRLPDYAVEIGDRIADARVVVLERCGHMPNIERSEAYNEVVLNFLTAPYPANERLPCSTTTS